MAVVADAGELECLDFGRDTDPAQFNKSTKTVNAGVGENLTAEETSYKECLPSDYGDKLFPQIACHFLATGAGAKAVIDRERRIAWANSAATALLKTPLPVTIGNGFLAFEAGVSACHEWLGRVGPQPLRHFVCGASVGSWVVINAYSRQLDGSEVVLAEFTLSHPPLRARTSGMSAQFGLTPAECDIIDALVRLEGPNEIAVRMGVSINTVRTHIRRLFGKLSVNSQVQLIRIATAFSAG